MKLSDYFENTRGLGVLATADADGAVDVAVYARPHVVSEDTVAFIMADRLSHANLQANPHAAYLFHEAGGGHRGKRVYLTKVGEEADPEKIKALRRRGSPLACTEDDEPRFLVTFRIDRIRPLVGGADGSGG